MSLSINQNIMAMNSYRNLSSTQNGLSKSLEKLSSGFRINRAADDAAGLAISEGLRSQVGGNKQAVRNAQDGISVVQTAEGALQEAHSILQRMRDLAVQGANDSNDSKARENIGTELNQLRDELERIGNVTNFNGTKLLDGTASGAKALKFQVGANGTTNDAITVDLKDADVTALSNFTQKKEHGDIMSGKVSLEEGTFTFKVGGKEAKVTLAASPDEKAVKAALGEALAKSGISGFVEGGEPVVAGAEVTTLGSGQQKDQTWTLELAGEKIVAGVGAGSADPNAMVQNLQQKISENANLNGKYEASINADTNKVEIKALGEAANKQVDVKLTSSNTDLGDSGVLIDSKVGVASGGEYKFTVDGTDVTVTRADGGAFDRDLSNFVTKHGTTPGDGDEKVDVELKDAAGGTPAAPTGDAAFVSTLTVKDHKSAQNLISVLDSKIQSVSTARANLGAIQNRFEHTITNLNVAVENLSASESRIRDTDMAQEMMQFTRNQILSQAGTAMLAQANQVPQGVLSLLR